jgi:hypothetical protein
MRYFSLAALLTLATYATAADATCMNKTCPISGKPVDPTVAMVPFNPKTDTAGKTAPAGKTDMVGFCCPKCEATYDKNPGKYRADLEKQRAN